METERIREGVNITHVHDVHIERCMVSATTQGRDIQPPIYYFVDGDRTGTFELHGLIIREIELIEFLAPVRAD